LWIHVPAAARPRGLRKIRIQVYALEPIGTPLDTVHVEEVFALVGGPPPRGLLAAGAPRGAAR
jgi:hypothetical protein